MYKNAKTNPVAFKTLYLDAGGIDIYGYLKLAYDTSIKR